jgi:hypothetical protein
MDFPKNAVFSSTASDSALGATVHSTEGTEPYRLHHSLRGTCALAALLLAASVATLVVIADQVISSWTDDHLFLGWVALLMVVLAGTALFAAPARLLPLWGMAGMWAGARAE